MQDNVITLSGILFVGFQIRILHIRIPIGEAFYSITFRLTNDNFQPNQYVIKLKSSTIGDSNTKNKNLKSKLRKYR